MSSESATTAEHKAPGTAPAESQAIGAIPGNTSVTTTPVQSIRSVVEKTPSASSTTPAPASAPAPNPAAEPSAFGAIKTHKRAIALCILTAFSGFIFGWDVGTVGGITNMSSFKHTFGSEHNGEYSLPSIIVGVIISVFNIACAIGSLFFSKLADHYGRKIAIYISLAIYIVGTILQCTAAVSEAWYHFMIGRIFSGLAVGMTSVVCPMFISESAPIAIRGSMVVFYQLMITLGILLGGVVNLATKLSYQDNNASWLVPVGLCFLWAFIVFAGLAGMPESAVYYISKGQSEQAAQSLAKLNNTEVDDVLVTTEIEKLENNHREVQAATAGATLRENIQQVFNGAPKYGQRLLAGVGIMFFQQFSGCNYFFYYGTSLFAKVGIEDSYVTAVILGAVNFVATFGGIYLVEKLGRKNCFFFGSALMGTCMFIYALLGSQFLENNANCGIGMIVVTCFYIIGFATTWGPVAFVSISELYPVKTKAYAMGFATAVNWVSNFLISLFTPMITARIGYNLGWVFFGCLLASAVFVALLVPETKGKRIEEIDAYYVNGKKFVNEDEE